MSILDIFRKQPKPADKQGGLVRTWSQSPRSETTRLPQLYHQTPRLDPIDLIASTIAGADIQLFDRAQLKKQGDEAEPLAVHPFYELMESPSKDFPEIDGYATKYVTAVLVELLGEAFWIKLRDGSGNPEEVLVMPPAWCILTPTRGSPWFLFQPFGTTAGSVIKVAPTDVVWFKQPDMTDPYGRGRGRTEAVGGELDSDEMAEKWQRNFYYNDATSPLWINVQGAQSSDLERIRDTWGQRLGGWMNARKPAFTNAEGISVTKLSDTPKEMDFVESRRFLRDVFLQHYAIPPEMFGILENSNRATIDASYYLFAKNVIARRLGFYERAITKQMIQPDYDARLVAKFDFDIPEDEDFKLRKVNEGIARGTLTRADWKRAMGYPVDPTDDVYLLPFSIQEVPRGQRPEPPEPEGIELPESDKPEPVKAVKALDARKAAHWKASDNRARQGEGMFRTRVRAFSEVQSARVKKALASKGPKAYKAALDEVFEGGDEPLKRALAPAWLASMTDGAEIGRDFMGLKVSPSFALYNKAFDEWVKTYGLLKAKEINETTFDELRKKLDAELAAGIEAGESIEALADRMIAATDGVYENMSGFRAELIARTETMSSVNFGQEAVYKAEGVEVKEWLATPDEDTRDDHAAADGQQVKIDESFDVGGEEMEYPGDPRGSAGNVCNCRCTIIPVVEL